jgi:competence protein ComEC
VPAALLGSFLYPFGLDGFIWHYLSFGINLVLWIGGAIARWPYATIYVPAFAPWSLIPLALAVLNVVLWRGWLRLLGVPFLCLGLWGCMHGDHFDLIVPEGADALAFRGHDGQLWVMGKSPNHFAVEQWLRSDGDGRDVRAAIAFVQHRHTQSEEKAAAITAFCDAVMCRAEVMDGRKVILVYEMAQLKQFCAEADILVAPFYAPDDCAAPIIIDRRLLHERGAIAFDLRADQDILFGTRMAGDDRPWWPASQNNSRSLPLTPEMEEGVFDDNDEERLNSF